MTLVPCPQCQRHIGTHHDACPFCQNAVPAGFGARAVPGSTKRLDRWATFTFAAALTVAACGGTSGDGTIGDGGTGDAGNGGSSDGGGGGTADGGGASDAGLLKDSGPKDDGGVVALYGLPPPPDAGALDGGGHDANVQPLYGLPALDSGADDGGIIVKDSGGVGALYGLPPPPD